MLTPTAAVPAGAQPHPWNISELLVIGNIVTGSLDVEGGGVVSGSGSIVGNTLTGRGTVTVSGLGSVWNTGTGGSSLIVGNIGGGEVNIVSRGKVYANGLVILGNVEGSSGTIVVDSGGEFTSTDVLVVGEEGDGSGSSWSMNDLHVGGAGTGRLDITDGGHARNDNGYIGLSDTSVGVVTVERNGFWENGANLYVGESGRGTLNIRDGGIVHSGFAYIGNQLGAAGTVTVDGLGSVWQMSAGNLYVGNDGAGALNITNGGSVSNIDAFVGETNVGSVIVNGAQSAWTNRVLYVGVGGIGSLAISDGGRVDAVTSGIGINPGSTGSAVVDGAGSLWFTGGLFTIGSRGEGVLTVANGGTVETAGVGIWLGNNGGHGRINIGADPATSTPTAPGTLDTAAVSFQSPSSALAFNHTGTNYTFAPELRGDGLVSHFAGTTILTANSGLFTGAADITGGMLRVDGTLGGFGSTVTVASGGVLAGGGTIGGQVTIRTGGILAPGNSIGTLNVASATFDAGSAYAVELNDGGFVAGTNNDLLNASGGVTINGGTLHVTPENGTDNGTTYSPGTYTVITAAGGVTGTFDSVTDDFAFLAFTDSYDASNVFLTSSMDVPSFCLAGYTGNQCATGEGVFSIGGGTLYTAVLNLSTAEAPAALDQLSGEVHASAQTALIDDSRFAREAAMDRLRVALEGTAADRNSMVERRIHDGFAFWGQGFGSWGNWNGDGNAAELDRSIGGFFLGADAFVTETLRLGVFGGYGRSSFDVSDRTSTGSADTWHLGAYGGTTLGNLGLRFGGSYAWHDIETTRSVAFAGFSDNLSGSYGARTGQVFGEAGYRFDLGAVSFEPFAGLAYVHHGTDGYAERGGAAALITGSQSMDTTFATIGLRAQTQISLGGTDTRIFGMAGWRHAFGDVTPLATHAFSGRDNFTVAGVPISRDALVLDLGASVNLTPDATLGVSYSGQFGPDFVDQGIKANLAVRF